MSIFQRPFSQNRPQNQQRRNDSPNDSDNDLEDDYSYLNFPHDDSDDGDGGD